MTENENIFNRSDIFIENRESIRITGVTDVDSFDDDTVRVKTQKGDILIGGEQLKINKLDIESAELSIEGIINSIIYEESAAKPAGGSFFGKFFS